MKIGFIGLGIMGRPMAAHLIRGGHEIHGYDLVGIPAELVEMGARAEPDARSVAAASEIVILMVQDTPHVEAALFDADGVAEGLSPGKLVIDMSSISPLATKGFAARINELGCDYLDAPVSGGEIGAQQATLTVMAGGPQAAFDRAKPVLELMGRTVTLIGDNGAGQTCKVANQIIVGLTVEAVAEALLFAAKAGADPAKVRAALMGGAAGSVILENHGRRMIERNFEPGFRVELQQKDLALALAGARTLGISLPNTASTQELFNACVARGEARSDHSIIVRTLERMADFEIGGPTKA